MRVSIFICEKKENNLCQVNYSVNVSNHLVKIKKKE